MSCLSLEERLADVNPTEVMNYFKPEQRFADLSVEEIEVYLKQRKKQD